jgi:hypothetical protein
MGADAFSQSARQPAENVRRLVDDARALRRAARAALDAGDLKRAAELVARAETLAANVHLLVDVMEERQTRQLMHMAAEQHAAASRRRSRLLGSRSRRIGVALGASLAMGLVLAEW